MQEQTITCPNCGTSIPLSKALTQQIDQNIRKEYDEKLHQEKINLWPKALKIAQEKAREKLDLELRDQQNQLTEQKKAIEEFKQEELKLRKEKRELEEAQKKIELESARKLDEERKKIAESERKKADEENHLKLLEKDKQMEMMKKTIADLKRTSEQGSMQIQGDVQEGYLKQILKAEFPIDIIDDVAVGKKGADLIQTVNSQTGKKAGIILWESKNTKDFKSDYIKKIKDDQIIAKADICILVTKTLPKEITNFSLLQGSFITNYQFVIPLSKILRSHLLKIASIKQSLVGKDKKMEFLYNYLLSSEFNNKMGHIINAFTTLKLDLEAEKRAMQRIWSKREKEIERVISNTSSFYGDLQGVIGSSLPKIPNLELPEGNNDDLK